ncbi:sensor histidine kinase [Azospirillum halopraeferens]|uniref:sensor histidine kinase n=1 Tax=Azospirillum halopraeferens TaxID=34010 RepID=UPI0004014EB5|nr:HAMP domain-containing sensor histidine kinase [Azospirillum halopraeferens]
MKIRFERPRSIRGQLVALLLLALALVQCLSVWLFIKERSDSILATLAKDGTSRVLTVANALEAAPGDRHSAIMQAAESLDFRLSIDRSALSDAPGADPLSFPSAHIRSVLAASPQRSVRLALIEGEAMAALPTGLSHDEDDDPYQLAVSASLRDGRWLNARIDTGGPPLQWAWPALASMLLTGAAVIAVVWVLVGRISRPLQQLAENAERLGRGGAVQPMGGSGPDEVRRLATAFDDMSDRLTRLLAERATMLAALGHDLRSPITAMRLRLEMVDEEETRERMGNCLDEMQTLVESALALARGAGTAEPMVRVDLGRMLGHLVDELREAGGDASASITDDVIVEARQASLKRAVRNIAENAIRYGGQAWITLLRSEDRALIIIEDNGPGIPVQERERVFEPFVRLETSRSRDTGGSGLGLAISKMVVESNGGSLTAEDARNGGARFVVSLPVNAPGLSGISCSAGLS